MKPHFATKKMSVVSLFYAPLKCAVSQNQSCFKICFVQCLKLICLMTVGEMHLPCCTSCQWCRSLFVVQVRSTVFLEMKHHFYLVFLWLVHVHCTFSSFLEWNLLFKIFLQTYALCLEWCVRKISAEFMMTLLGTVFSIYIIQKDMKLHWDSHCNPWLAVDAYKHNKLSLIGMWAWYRVGHSCCKPAGSDQWYVSEKIRPCPKLNAIGGSLIFPTRG